MATKKPSLSNLYTKSWEVNSWSFRTQQLAASLSAMTSAKCTELLTCQVTPTEHRPRFLAANCLCARHSVDKHRRVPNKHTTFIGVSWTRRLTVRLSSVRRQHFHTQSINTRQGDYHGAFSIPYLRCQHFNIQTTTAADQYMYYMFLTKYVN